MLSGHECRPLNVFLFNKAALTQFKQLIPKLLFTELQCVIWKEQTKRRLLFTNT